jgi:undecaprenyl phosphate-alpha-L-ara4N flippase subunit ArnE
MKLVLAYVAMIGCTVIANLLFKTGAMNAAKGAGLLAFLNPYLIGGVATFGVSAAIYIVVLQWLPLNVAQSYLSAQFVAVVLASALFLSEPISTLQWVGIGFITAGIFLVGHAGA